MIERLRKEIQGYPFGLVIEHAFVELTDARAFHKADPHPLSRMETIYKSEALAPYLQHFGFELTYHRRRSW